MQHNLLVLNPGSLRRVGKASDDMARESDAAERNYIPEHADILSSTPLLNPGDTYILRMKLPEEAGDYPFVCTFPGHWQTMNGLIRVR